jgi:hypothetical protein
LPEGGRRAFVRIDSDPRAGFDNTLSIFQLIPFHGSHNERHTEPKRIPNTAASSIGDDNACSGKQHAVRYKSLGSHIRRQRAQIPRVAVVAGRQHYLNSL